MATVLTVQYIGAHIDILWRSTFGNRTFQVGSCTGMTAVMAILFRIPFAYLLS